VEILLVLYTIAWPESFGYELAAMAHHAAGADVHPSTINRYLHEHRQSLKAIKIIASERDPVREKVWFSSRPPVGIRGVDRSKIVDIDEAAVLIPSSGRRKGWAFVSRECNVVAKYIRGPKWTVWVAFMVNGVLAVMVVKGANSTSRLFAKFLNEYVFPKLTEGGPYYLMMDNLRSHTTSEVTTLIARSGHVQMRRPPYAPPLAPVEKSFRFMRDGLRRRHHLLNEDNLVSAVLSSLSEISAQAASNVFEDCGY